MWFLFKDSHLLLTILFGFVLSGVFCGNDEDEIDDECIWEDRTYPGNDPPSVKNARTECSKGRLIWHHPYGGLRVSFHPTHIKGPFKLCFTSKHSGINIFQEGFKDLTLVKGSNDHKTKKRICLPSSNKYMVLYIEASKKEEHVVKVEYSIYSLKKKRHHKSKACRPCRYDKLIKLICKSDFAIRGYINSSYRIPHTPYLQTDVVAQDLIQQKHPIFAKREQDVDTEHNKGLVKVPSGCSWRKGRHKPLLMTGDIVQGKGPVMTCYTRDKEWLTLKKEYFKHLCIVFK